jgi:hypothetical protein
MRAAKIDPDSLKLYTARLTREHTGDVINALQKLAEMPRENFETAMPGVAEILELVKVERIARENRSEAKKSERLVRWECPSCHSVQSGFPAVNADLDRRCYKKITSDKNEELQCGAAMIVTFDEHEGGNLGPAQGVAKWEAPEWVNR